MINASKVEHRDRQQLAAHRATAKPYLGLSPSPGSTTAHATIHTPAPKSVRRDTPTVGASCGCARGRHQHALQVPVCIVQVSYHVIHRHQRPLGMAPEFAIHDLDSLDACRHRPAGLSDDIAHYLE